MKRLVIALALTCAAAVLANAQQAAYDREKMWDAEIRGLVEIDRRQTPPANPVLFVGSSSIRMWNSLRADFPKLGVVNRGFGGSRLEDVNHYFDKLVAPFGAKKIVLYAGENDINEGRTPEQVAADFVRFVALLRAGQPDAKLFYVSIKPSPSRWKLKAEMTRANDLIKAEIAKMKNVRYVDVWTPMLAENGEPKPDIFLADKLHMNEKGYAIWKQALAGLIK